MLHARIMKQVLLGLGLSATILLGVACPGKETAPGAGATGGKPGFGSGGAKPPTPVLAARAQKKDLPVVASAPGTVEPFSTVSIKSQVSGQLIKVNFKEGDYVKKGDLLFNLDDRPFVASLHQAEANLAKDQVQAKNAENNAQRYADMANKNAVAQTEYDTARTSAQALQAQVLADQAAVENMKLQLAYCTIKAPISGRTGDLQVDEGNLVKANDVPLVTINQVEPVNVAFSLPESQMAELRRHMSGTEKLKVTAAIPQDSAEPESGELTFLNNQVDPQTGTIGLKATFANADKHLWPGLFVNVQLTLTTLSGAIVVPSQAVQTGQSGQYVYVIQGDGQKGKVQMRTVTTGEIFGDDLVITNGLKEAEQVVTDGQLRLVPGDAVMVKSGLMPEVGEKGQAREVAKANAKNAG